MAENLLTTVKSYITDGVISQASDLLNETPQHTQKAFDGAFPTILGGLVQQANEPGGIGSVMDMVGEVMSPDRAAGEVVMPVGGIPAHLYHYLTETNELAGLKSMGSSIIQQLFGEKEPALSNSLASYSGVNSSSASTVMSLAAPILLGVIGKKIADDGTGISGLASLLSEQSEHIQSALPSALGSLLGSIPSLGILGGLTSQTNNIPPTVADPLAPVTNPVSGLPPLADPVYPAYESAQPAEPNQPSDGGNRWLPWLLLALGVVALFFIFRSCQSGNKETTSSTTSDSTTSASSAMDSAGSTMIAAADTLSVDMAKLGAFFKRKLPTGVELNIPENGIENNLVKFIEDKNRPVDKTTWFNFGRLLFDTGKATLRPDSKAEVPNIAEILKAFPNVNIKIGGYTDNTGSAELNKKLSQERATTVMNELVQLGIAKSRLEAEGYGPEHPVASNDTAAGRAENRRIAVRVTKK